MHCSGGFRTHHLDSVHNNNERVLSTCRKEVTVFWSCATTTSCDTENNVHTDNPSPTGLWIVVTLCVYALASHLHTFTGSLRPFCHRSKRHIDLIIFYIYAKTGHEAIKQILFHHHPPHTDRAFASVKVCRHEVSRSAAGLIM